MRYINSNFSYLLIYFKYDVAYRVRIVHGVCGTAVWLDSQQNIETTAADLPPQFSPERITTVSEM